MSFSHDIAGGQGNLIVTSLQSPNYDAADGTGWQITSAGDATFYSITIPDGAGGTVVVFGPTEPADPVNGEVWYDTANGLAASVYGPGGWTPYYIGTNAISDNAITSALIADDAVGTDQIIAGAVTQDLIADAAVGTGQISDNAITQALIASGAVGTDQIEAQAITTDLVADNAITQALIADDAVGTAQIIDGSITTALIADSAVGTSQIASSSVTNALIAASAVEAENIADGAVTATQINAAAGILGSQLSDTAGIQAGQVGFNATDIGGINVTYSNTAPSNPNTGDIWIQTT